MANKQLSLAVLLLFLIHSKNVTGVTSDFETRLDAFVNSLMSCTKRIGLSVAAVSGNDTVLAKGFGTASLERNSSVTNTTVFSVASISKAYGATLLGIILKEKGYTYDTPMRELMGSDFYLSDGRQTRYATPRDLLAHRLGVPGNNYCRLQTGFDREMVSRKIRFFNATNEFRNSYLYNNLMHGVTSHLTEVLGGKPWEELMRERIFRPLGMDSATFQQEVDLNGPDVAGHYLSDPPRRVSNALLSHWGKIGASGSIMYSAHDAAKWLKMQLNEGATPEGVQVVPRDVLLETHRGVTSVPRFNDIRGQIVKPYTPVTFSSSLYGLGWFTGEYRGYPVVMHTGSSLGQTAINAFLPTKQVGVHISFVGPDRGYFSRFRLNMVVLDLLLGEEPWLNTTSICSFPQSTASEKGPSANFDTSTASRYEGTYGNFGYGNMTIFLNGSTLNMQYGSLGYFELVPAGEDNAFTAEGKQEVWIFTFRGMKFQNLVNGRFTEVYMGRFHGAVFTRGLKLSDAPPPESPECNSPSGSTSVRINVVAFISAWAIFIMLTGY